MTTNPDPKNDTVIATADRVLADPEASADAKTCALALKKWEVWSKQIASRGRAANP